MFSQRPSGLLPLPTALIWKSEFRVKCNSWSNRKAQKSTDNGKQTRVLDVKLKTLKKATLPAY